MGGPGAGRHLQVGPRLQRLQGAAALAQCGPESIPELQVGQLNYITNAIICGYYIGIVVAIAKIPVGLVKLFVLCLICLISGWYNTTQQII